MAEQCPASAVYINYEDSDWDDGDNRIHCILARDHAGLHHDDWHDIWWQTEAEHEGI